VRLVLASGNPNKLRELRLALPGWEVELLGAVEAPVEDGETFLENATIKARHGRLRASPEDWVAGEDSGIEVAALGGAPGVRSARWAEDPVAALLERLAGDDERRARYVCELVLLSPAGEEFHARGTLEGEIAFEPRGGEGFGYDPIFVPSGESRTVAELGNAWKSDHSHRALAARALAEVLAGRRRVVASPPMDVAQALSELTELSSQIRRAVVLDAEGAVLGATGDDPAAADVLAGAARELVAVAGDLRGHAADAGVTRVEV
jgi:XTP/dITP diphosphohydrolase